MMTFRQAVERGCDNIVEIYKVIDNDPRGEMKYDIFDYEPVDTYFKDNEFSIRTILSTKAFVDLPIMIGEERSVKKTIMNVVLAEGKFYSMKLYNSYIDSYICIAFAKNTMYVYSEDSTECANAYALPVNFTEESLKDKDISPEIFDIIYSGVEGFMLSNKIEE